MSLLDAPVYDEKKEKLKQNLLIAAGVLAATLALLSVLGFLLGHGWLFSNLLVERKVDRFFTAIETHDFSTAYALYTNDDQWQQHPAQHKDYPLARFTEDWTTASPIHEPIISHHVDISKTDGSGPFGSGIIVAVTVNHGKKLFMWYQRSDGTLTEPAPHVLEY